MSNQTGAIESSIAALGSTTSSTSNSNFSNMSTTITSTTAVPETFVNKPVLSQGLRRPHDSTISRVVNGNSEPNQDSSGNGDPGSNLSPTAKEFYPKSLPDDGTNIHKLKKPSVLSASAKEFVPMNTHIVQDEDISQYSSFAQLSMCPAHLNSSSKNSWKECPVDAFKMAIFHLRTHPGNLDDYMKPVTDVLNRNKVNEQVLGKIVDILFEECVTVPNFRYTGARICKYISSIKEESLGVNFRTSLLKRCEKEHAQRIQLISSEETIPRLCGMSLFIAELFLLLEVERNGVSEKYSVLRNAIHSLLQLLLTNSNDQTVKCATQLIKLAGATIEDSKHPSARSFDNIYQSLEDLKHSPKLNKTSQMLIDSVLNLKAKDFGRLESTCCPEPNVSCFSTETERAVPPVNCQNMAAHTDPDNTLDLTNEPVFFNEKGQQISRDEAGYEVEVDLKQLLDEVELDENFDEHFDIHDIDVQSFEIDDEMDDEMMRCYEEFLQYSKK